MSDIELSKAVAEWIDNHTWPRATDNRQSLLVLNAFSPANPTVFKFHSAFSYFEVHAIHNRDTTSLTELQIQLVVPGKSESTTLMVVDSYPLSTDEGQPLIFNLDNGYVRGTLSFKYKNYNGEQYVFVTYRAHLPYAGDLEDTVNIAPTRLDEAAGFTAERLETIPTLTVSELKLVEERTLSGQVVIRALDQQTTDRQALLVKFLRDFVLSGEGSVVIATYGSEWAATVSFIGVLELVGSVDPVTLAVSATLYARIPIIGRVRLTGIEDYLVHAGASVDIDDRVATGKATFTASQNLSGKYDLFVEASLSIKFYGTIRSSGKDRLLTFPF